MYPAEGFHISTFPKVDAKADCLDSRRVSEGHTRLCDQDEKGNNKKKRRCDNHSPLSSVPELPLYVPCIQGYMSASVSFDLLQWCF